MSDYAQITDFSAKDALVSGDPEKLILGSDVDDELAAISVAIATKYDSNDLASQAQAEAETSNVVLMTPLRVANWSDYNAGMVGDIQALTDPNDDRIIGWDDSAGAAIAYDLSTGLTTSGTNLLIDTAVVPQLSAANSFTNASQKITTSEGSPRWWLDDGTITASFQIDSTNNWGQLVVHTAHALKLGTNNSIHFEIDSSGNFDFNDGTVTTDNLSASEVGFKGMPIASMTSDASISLSTSGNFVYYTGAGGHTLTIPANGSVAIPVGTVIGFFNNGSGSFSIAITTDTLIWAGSGSTGTRTIALYGQGALTKIASNAWTISGVGIS
jgi:hypothetical protein